MGRICYMRVMEKAEEGGSGDAYDLPFDVETKDIVCQRAADGKCHFNIPQIVVHHSPSGMAWGYGGSGAADFALSILEAFCEDRSDMIEVWRGRKCSRIAWDLHQDFKWEFIATMSKEGGEIKGDAIRAWIKSKEVPPLMRAEKAEEVFLNE